MEKTNYTRSNTLLIPKNYWTSLVLSFIRDYHEPKYTHYIINMDTNNINDRYTLVTWHSDCFDKVDAEILDLIIKWLNSYTREYHLISIGDELNDVQEYKKDYNNYDCEYDYSKELHLKLHVEVVNKFV